MTDMIWCLQRAYGDFDSYRVDLMGLYGTQEEAETERDRIKAEFDLYFRITPDTDMWMHDDEKNSEYHIFEIPLNERAYDYLPFSVGIDQAKFAEYFAQAQKIMAETDEGAERETALNLLAEEVAAERKRTESETFKNMSPELRKALNLE